MLNKFKLVTTISALILTSANVLAQETTGVIVPSTETNITATGSATQSMHSTRTYNYATSTAYSPNLTSGMDTCLGSVGAGLQGFSFGASFGSTVEDENCMRIKKSKRLEELGFRRAAIAVMCKDPQIAEAMGEECFNSLPIPAKVYSSVSPKEVKIK